MMAQAIDRVAPLSIGSVLADVTSVLQHVGICSLPSRLHCSVVSRTHLTMLHRHVAAAPSDVCRLMTALLMTLAPQSVEGREAGLVENMLVFSLVAGLTAGAVAGWLWLI